MQPVPPSRTDIHRSFLELYASGIERTGVTVSHSELSASESSLGVSLPGAYREFLLAHGAVPVAFDAREDELLGNSRCPVFDRFLGPAEMLKANAQSWFTPVSWHITGLPQDASADVFWYLVAFAMDGSGNYVGFPRCKVASDDLPVLLFDHDLGGIHQLAPSFDQFLWAYVQPSPPRAREELIFSTANDHNPVYRDECERCGGFGTLFVVRYDQPRRKQDDLVCPDCDGTGQVEKKRFDNDSPPAEADVGADGWVKCPRCRWRFATHDRNAWTGYRHKRCGQRLILRTK